MTIVIDSSVALKWVLDEPDSDAALALQTQPLTAPALWLIEAANVLWVNARRGDISSAEANLRLRRLQSGPIATSPIEDDIVDALRLASELAHPVYDCLYLAAAIREGADVVTADARFVAAVAQRPEHAARVRLLGA